MSDYVEKWLRIAAEEIRADGHAGWGNTCEDGANHIAGLERYIAEIERGKVEALGMAAELEAENARLRKNLQFCREVIAEADEKIIPALESRIHEAIEVYAGMEGFIPKTAPEAYCLRIIDQMNKALLGCGDGPKDL